MQRLAALLAALGAAAAQGTTRDFPAGWNGMARTPPLGWRSWNAFGNHITDQTIRDAIDAITEKVWVVDKKPVSLADVGYASVGIDEGWEGCGEGVNNTQHTAEGTPVINSKFPDMKALVDYGHSKGLKMGWYLNGCACGEKVELLKNYQGDIQTLHSLGFDAVKIDGCGAQTNMTYYAELMRATGQNYSIENCHWGQCGAFKGDPDGSSCPTDTWCPFNWYRTSGDINAGNMSWFTNLQTTRKFQAAQPLARPGCWAYPDMLEVGRVQGSPEWNRAHFGAWCIVSAPLVLGLDLTQKAKVTEIIPVVTNAEALAVNQQWAGHPGGLVKEVGGAALDSPKVQIWSKPQPGGAVAVLVINPTAAHAKGHVELSELGLKGAAAVRDIWRRSDAGRAERQITYDVPATDSEFLLLTPQ
eukprot:TRINITY_DN449_c0_g4_i1.p1 TRINITY_DN449_c0_g4~~TRINITY_DN449_c0_g4_i1.p1  ORF type:complete len:439 (+),score=174.67 TRINITY_DN449_c0_g4_i1:73-1317(+)